MRWFTADRIAQRNGEGDWHFAPHLYLAVNESGVIEELQAQRPPAALIIHDLGHVLLAPPGLMRCDPRAEPSRDDLEPWLMAQLREGRAAMMGGEALRARALALGLLTLDQHLVGPRGLQRTVHPLDAQRSVVGSLGVGDPFDALAWDLDAPVLSSLPEEQSCARIWARPSLGQPIALWVAGQPRIYGPG